MFGEELDDALCGGAGGSVGDGAPGAVERALATVFCWDTVPTFLPLGLITSQSMRMLCLPPQASRMLTVPLTV